MARWKGRASVRGSSEAMRMILLTFCAVGITFTWGIEMTYCTPYLLDLGLTKSSISMVWVAGPLSGLLVQPIVGVVADESTSRWGRRRPLMVAGAVVVAASLLLLGFTKELVGSFIADEGAARRPTIVLAVLAIYVVDFAINAIMSCSRSLIVDTLPIDKQHTGAAWASRMSAVGHMIGYSAGAVDLVKLFGPTLGRTQFQQLTVIAAVTILFSTALTCWAVTERVLIAAPMSAAASVGENDHFKVLRQIYSTLLHLPPRIQAICWGQFWSWIGWFPFLFYSTTWVGETYFRYDVPADARQSKDALGDMGRIGSTSLVLYSIVTLVGAFALPLLVQSPGQGGAGYTPRPPQAMAGLLAKLSGMKPDLLTTWISGHLMFAGAMFLAPFATSFRFATFLVCLCGLPWTVAMWAPTALLGIEVNKLGSADINHGRRSSNAGGIPSATYHRLSDAKDDDFELPRTIADNASSRFHHDPDAVEDAGGGSSSGELSGIYFGILNIYSTLPQFIGTFISSVVFALLEPEEADSHPEQRAGEDRPNAIAVCLFIGAMASVVAAFVTRRLRYL